MYTYMCIYIYIYFHMVLLLLRQRLDLLAERGDGGGLRLDLWKYIIGIICQIVSKA